MTITYKLLLDKPFYRTVVNRYYKQRPVLLKLPVQFLFVVILSFCVWVYAWKGRSEWSMIAVWGFLYLAVLSAVSFFFPKWAIVHRFVRRADFNTGAILSLSDHGIVVSGQHAKSEMEWAAYPKAVDFPGSSGHA